MEKMIATRKVEKRHATETGTKVETLLSRVNVRQILSTGGGTERLRQWILTCIHDQLLHYL